MKINLKDQKLKKEDLQPNTFYVGGSQGTVYYYTISKVEGEKLHQFISIGDGYNLSAGTLDDLWKAVVMYSLRKADFELNEI